MLTKEDCRVRCGVSGVAVRLDEDVPITFSLLRKELFQYERVNDDLMGDVINNEIIGTYNYLHVKSRAIRGACEQIFELM